MQVKNNYKECLTNLACSIRKYFELEYKHNTLEYIDQLIDSNISQCLNKAVCIENGIIRDRRIIDFQKR